MFIRALADTGILVLLVKGVDLDPFQVTACGGGKVQGKSGTDPSFSGFWYYVPGFTLVLLVKGVDLDPFQVTACGGGKVQGKSGTDPSFSGFWYYVPGFTDLPSPDLPPYLVTLLVMEEKGRKQSFVGFRSSTQPTWLPGFIRGHRQFFAPKWYQHSLQTSLTSFETVLVSGFFA